MRIKKVIYFLITSLVLLLAFQNCKLTEGQLETKSEVKSFYTLEGGGTGESYDGKLNAYNRNVPGYTCNDRPEPIEIIDFTPSKIRLAKRDPNQCTKQNFIGLKEKNLIKSQNTPYILGHERGIYFHPKLFDSVKPQRTFIEAWCKGISHNQEEYDVVISNHDSNLEVRIFTSGSSVPSSIKIIKRSINISELRYSGSGFYLKVPYRIANKDTAALPSYFIGLVDSQYYSNKTLSCRLGGQFDEYAPTVQYSSSSKVLALNKPITPIELVPDEPIESFSISPELPSGLSFNTQSGSITGVPTEISPISTYDIKMKLKFGSLNNSIELGVGYDVQVHNLGLTKDDSIGDLLCRDASGVCSLQALIDESNLNPDIPFIGYLPVGEVNITNPLKVSGNIFLKGLNTSLNANSQSRHFQVSNGFLSMEGIHLVNGLTSEVGGGSIYAKNSSLDLKNVTFNNNFSDTSSGCGGAIYLKTGSIYIDNSSFTKNRTRLSGGGLYGGAICGMDIQRSIVKNSHFSENEAHWGGAVYIDTLANSEISFYKNNVFQNNKASDGGALLLYSGYHLIFSSIFTDNIARLRGGAIELKLTRGFYIRDSSFTRNSSKKGVAIYYDAFGASTQGMIVSSEFTNNQKDAFSRTYSPNVKVPMFYNYRGQMLFRDVIIKNVEDTMTCAGIEGLAGNSFSFYGNNDIDEIKSCEPTP